MKRPDTRHDGVTIGLHWLSALLVLVAVVLIESKGWLPKAEGLRESAKLWHFQIGALVLLATLCRAIWRLVAHRPAPATAMATRPRRLASAAHGLLYLMLLLLPLSGVAMLIFAGKPVSLLGWELPVWAEESRSLAKSAKRIHESAGKLMIALVVLHAAAALWHQFVRRDGVLVRMLPRSG